MFTNRLEKAYYCCHVRTGALVISTIFSMMSVVGVIVCGYMLASFDDNVKLAETAVGMEANLVKKIGESTEELDQAVGIMEASKGTIRHILQGTVIYAVGELVINLLLIFGLAQRRHVGCLPWLIYNFLGLITWTIGFSVATISMWVIGATGPGFMWLFLGGGVGAAYFYAWKVVQSEWMNIKDLAAQNQNRQELVESRPPPY